MDSLVILARPRSTCPCNRETPRNLIAALKNHPSCEGHGFEGEGPHRRVDGQLDGKSHQQGQERPLDHGVWRPVRVPSSPVSGSVAGPLARRTFVRPRVVETIVSVIERPWLESVGLDVALAWDVELRPATGCAPMGVVLAPTAVEVCRALEANDCQRPVSRSGIELSISLAFPTESSSSL